MKTKSQLIVFAFTLLFLTACNAATEGQQTVEQMAWEAINNGALLVDVRTASEYYSGHLERAKLIPVDQIADRLSEFGSDKNRQIVVYCRSGNRAGKAQAMLQRNGYTNVINGGGYQSMLSAKP